MRSIRSGAGFTLIELLVVVSIIALVTAMAMPSLSSFFNVSINSATRDLAGVIKEAYNSSVITGKVYRLAYDLKEETYWVEAGPQPAAAEFLLDTAASKEKDKRQSRFTSPTSKPAESAPFAMDKLITRKKVALPRGVSFEDIMTQQDIDPLTTGMAYTHFFPQGLTEQAIIHLQDKSKHRVSLVITPLIGRTDFYDHYIQRQDVFGK